MEHVAVAGKTWRHQVCIKQAQKDAHPVDGVFCLEAHLAVGRSVPVRHPGWWGEMFYHLRWHMLHWLSVMAVSKAGVLRAVENYVEPSLSGVPGTAKSP